MVQSKKFKKRFYLTINQMRADHYNFAASLSRLGITYNAMQPYENVMKAKKIYIIYCGNAR